MHTEQCNPLASADASVVRGAPHREEAQATGRYEVVCIGAEGKEKWRDSFDNLVTTQGKNKALDVHLRGQTQITTWYLGLISSVSWSAVNAADVAAQINGTNGWKEAGNANAPSYGSTRGTLTVGNASAAGSLTASAATAFSITGSGTIKGCF